MNLKTDQTLVGHSHKWHATIAPAHATVFISVHKIQGPQHKTRHVEPNQREVELP